MELAFISTTNTWWKNTLNRWRDYGKSKLHPGQGAAVKWYKAE